MGRRGEQHPGSTPRKALLPPHFPAVNNKLSSLRGPAAKPRGQHPNLDSSRGMAGECVSPKSHTPNSTNKQSPTGPLQAEAAAQTSPGAAGTWHEAMVTEGPPSSCSMSPCRSRGVVRRIWVLQGWLSMIFVPHRAGNETPQRAREHQERNNSDFIQVPAAHPQHCLGHFTPPRPPAAAPSVDPTAHSRPGKGPSEVLDGQGGMQRAGGVRGGAGALGKHGWSQVDVGDVRGGARGLAAPICCRLGAEFLLGLGCLLQALG